MDRRAGDARKVRPRCLRIALSEASPYLMMVHRVEVREIRYFASLGEQAVDHMCI